MRSTFKGSAASSCCEGKHGAQTRKAPPPPPRHTFMKGDVGELASISRQIYEEQPETACV